MTSPHESYLSKVNGKRPNTKVIGKYVDCSTPILHRCKIHNLTYEGIPSKVLSKKECVSKQDRCKRFLQVNALHDTLESLTAKVTDTHKGTIKVVNWPVLTKRPTVQCLQCDRIWTPTKSNLITHGKGCVKCGIKRTASSLRKPESEYLKSLSQKTNGTIELVGSYTGARKPKDFKCKTCDFTWTTTSCKGCPHCSRVKSKTTGFQSKEYRLGSRTVSIQGFEDRALNWLRSNTKHKLRDIRVSSEGVLPVISYRFEGRDRNHFPDIMIKRKDGRTMIIEVKSTFTLGIQSWKGKPRMFQQNKAKIKAALSQGIDYRFMVFDHKQLIRLPKNWFELSAPKLAKQLGIKCYRY